MHLRHFLQSESFGQPRLRRRALDFRSGRSYLSCSRRQDVGAGLPENHRRSAGHEHRRMEKHSARRRHHSLRLLRHRHRPARPQGRKAEVDPAPARHKTAFHQQPVRGQLRTDMGVDLRQRAAHLRQEERPVLPPQAAEEMPRHLRDRRLQGHSIHKYHLGNPYFQGRPFP